MKIKVLNKVGRFELIQTNKHSFSIRVVNGKEDFPVSVEIYSGSGMNALTSARYAFDKITEAYKSAMRWGL